MEPTTVHALEAAIRQCDDGIALLSNQNYEGAIRCFSNSLRVAKEGINAEENNGDGNIGSACPIMVLRSTLLEQCMTASSAMEQPMHHMVQTNKQEDDHTFFFCHQAIPFLPIRSSREELFDGTHRLRDEDIQSILIVLSTVVLFNMALAHHLSANSVGSVTKDAKIKLTRAAKLYDLASSLQRSEELTNCVQFTMALLNNLGLVHKQLSNQELSQMCFEQLLSATMFVVTTLRMTSSVSGFNYSNSSTSQEQCPPQSRSLEGFLINMSNVCFKRLTAPAA